MSRREVLHETVLLALVFFSPLAFGCVESWAILALKFSAVLLVASGDSSDLSHPLLGAIVVTVSIGLLQLLHPIRLEGPSTFLPFTTSQFRTSSAVSLWFCYAVILWQATARMGNPAFRKRFLTALFLAGVIVSVIGIVQLAQGDPRQGTGLVYGFRPVRYGRSPFGPYFNQGHAASMLILALFAGGGLALSRIPRLRLDLGIGAIADWLAIESLYGIGAAIIIVALANIHNRGSSLALAFSSCIVALTVAGSIRTRSRRWVFQGGLLASLCAMLLLAPSIFERIKGSALSVPTRLMMYAGSGTMLGDFPLFGIGLGNVIETFHSYKNLALRGLVDHVHSDWLEFALEIGLGATALWLLQLSRFAAAIRAGLLGHLGSEERLLAAGSAAGVLCFSIHALVDFSLRIPGNAVLFFLLCACLWAQCRQRAGVPMSPRLRLIAVTFVLLAVIPELSVSNPDPDSCGNLPAPICHDILRTSDRLSQGLAPETLRESVRASFGAFREQPFHPSVRAFLAYPLWHLGRKNDAAELQRNLPR